MAPRIGYGTDTRGRCHDRFTAMTGRVVNAPATMGGDPNFWLTCPLG